MKKENIFNESSINYDHLLRSVHHLIFFTSGQCIILDKNGDQIIDLQIKFVSEESNIPLLKRIVEHAEKFTLCKWREWVQDVNKEDFIRITHLNYIKH